MEDRVMDFERSLLELCDPETACCSSRFQSLSRRGSELRSLTSGSGWVGGLLDEDAMRKFRRF